MKSYLLIGESYRHAAYLKRPRYAIAGHAGLLRGLVEVLKEFKMCLNL